MILVFGGTTEGRRAAEVLEEAGSPFFYSTKTVIRHCADYCSPLLPDGSLTILLIDDNGHIYPQ